MNRANFMGSHKIRREPFARSRAAPDVCNAERRFIYVVQSRRKLNSLHAFYNSEAHHGTFRIKTAPHSQLR